MRLKELISAGLLARKLCDAFSMNGKSPASDTSIMDVMLQKESSTSLVFTLMVVMIVISWFHSLGVRKPTQLSSVDQKNLI